MPNWCENHVTITHEDPAKIEEALAAFREGKLLNYAEPQPPELSNDELETWRAGGDELRKKLRAEMLEKYGYESWYTWRIDKWGTKWDVDGEVLDSSDNSLQLCFDSAWSPPIGAYRSLMDKGFEVSALYYESGSCYAGVFRNGEEHYFDTLEDALAGEFSEELDDTFDIRGYLAEVSEEEGD